MVVDAVGDVLNESGEKESTRKKRKGLTERLLRLTSKRILDDVNNETRG